MVDAVAFVVVLVIILVCRRGADNADRRGARRSSSSSTSAGCARGFVTSFERGRPDKKRRRRDLSSRRETCETCRLPALRLALKVEATLDSRGVVGVLLLAKTTVVGVFIRARVVNVIGGGGASLLLLPLQLAPRRRRSTNGG